MTSIRALPSGTGPPPTTPCPSSLSSPSSAQRGWVSRPLPPSVPNLSNAQVGMRALTTECRTRSQRSASDSARSSSSAAPSERSSELPPPRIREGPRSADDSSASHMALALSSPGTYLPPDSVLPWSAPRNRCALAHARPHRPTSTTSLTASGPAAANTAWTTAESMPQSDDIWWVAGSACSGGRSGWARASWRATDRASAKLGAPPLPPLSPAEPTPSARRSESAYLRKASRPRSVSLPSAAHANRTES